MHTPEFPGVPQNASPATSQKRQYETPELRRRQPARSCDFDALFGLCRLAAGHAGFHQVPLCADLDALLFDAQAAL